MVVDILPYIKLKRVTFTFLNLAWRTLKISYCVVGILMNNYDDAVYRGGHFALNFNMEVLANLGKKKFYQIN